MTTPPKIQPHRPGQPDVQGFIEEEQEFAIQRMVREFTEGSGAVCNASNMDTGKTLMASELVHRLGLRYVLYIGVKDTFDQWAGRLSAQSDGAIVLRRMDGTKAGKVAFEDWRAGVDGHYFVGSQFLTAQDWAHPLVFENGHPLWKRDKDGQIVVKPNDQIGPALLPVQQTQRVQLNTYRKMKRAQDLIVFDEVHVISNRKAIGRRTLLTIKAKWKLGMSGTWLGNQFANAWSITRWLWPDVIEGSYDRWEKQWVTTEMIRVAGGREQKVIKGEAYPGEFTKTLPCYIRMDGEDEIPEPELVYVDLLPEQRADYEDLERDLLVWLSTTAGQRAMLVADLPITLRARLRTATLGTMTIDHETNELLFAMDTKSTKLHALRGIVDRWPNEPVAIATDSKRFAKVVAARMQAAGYAAELWTGDVSSKDREALKERALRGEVPYLVHTIQAFSTGLDGFQKVYSKVVCLSESDNNMLMSQWIKRFFRRGRKEGFEWVKVVARDTFDEGVLSEGVRATLAMRVALAA